jgi:hypothetical protein
MTFMFWSHYYAFLLTPALAVQMNENDAGKSMGLTFDWLCWGVIVMWRVE